jgi:hypothetical protein
MLLFQSLSSRGLGLFHALGHDPYFPAQAYQLHFILDLFGRKFFKGLVTRRCLLDSF